MGFDVSYHAVDLSLLNEHIVPYILGEKEDEELYPITHDMARVEKIKLRCQQWRQLADVSSREEELSRFDFDLHTVGRPFFIVSDSPEETIEIFDRYHGCREIAEVDSIAREMFDKLSASSRVMPPAPSQMLENQQLHKVFLSEICFLRDCYLAQKKGVQKIRNLNGEEVDPLQVLVHHTPLCLLTFSSFALPGWIARGYVWPSLICKQFGLEQNVFCSNLELCRPLVRALSDTDFKDVFSISENYMVGGVILPPDCKSFRESFQTCLQMRIPKLKNQEVARHVAKCSQKINEALMYSAKKNLAFVEVTDLYDPFTGNMLN